MTNPAVSVVVVSRGRPDALRRCLAGVEQLAWRPFELVVVADPAGIAAITDWQGDVKWAEYDVPNISAARNIGARLAAGDILAFIDDDAVPEPAWLDHLIAPFADPQVAIAGGFVLGRDGVSYQYQANRLDRIGAHVPLSMGDAPQVFEAPEDGAIKTEGTNFAILRQVLADLGGFDEAYRYFKDETDLNMRLARVGARTALVPLALVHHGFEASERRTAEARALSLYDIGASTRVFLRKHVPPEDHDRLIAKTRRNQRMFQEKHMALGRCTREQAEAVLQTLEDGFAAGLDAPCGQPVDLGPSGTPFLAMTRGDRFTGSDWMRGRSWQRERLRHEAAGQVAGGTRMTLIVLEPTTRFLRVRFDPRGFWEHSGGQFGRTSKGDPLFRPFTLRSRSRAEIARVAIPRLLNG